MSKIMEPIYHILTHVGMSSHLSIKRHPFNMRNSIVLLLLGTYVAGTAMYLIYGATNLKEYTDCIYLFASSISAMVNFVFISWKMEEIFRFLKNLEDIVNTSKRHGNIKMKLNLFRMIFYTTLL